MNGDKKKRWIGERERKRERPLDREEQNKRKQKSMTGQLKDDTREEECLIQEMGQKERCGETTQQFIRQRLGEKNIFKRRERENEG